MTVVESLGRGRLGGGGGESSHELGGSAPLDLSETTWISETFALTWADMK